MIEKLPIDSSFLRNIQFLHPLARRDASSLKSMERISEEMPNVVTSGKMKDDLRLEWKELMVEDQIPDEWFIADEFEEGTKYHRLDHYWRNVFDIKAPDLKILLKFFTQVLRCMITSNHI